MKAGSKLARGLAAVGWIAAALLMAEARGGETMTVTATAYSWREPAHAKWGKKNALGGRLDQPVEGRAQIAVDPGVIPLGSLVVVKGLGTRIATDTGGRIHGRRIDVHAQTLEGMNRWGKRQVEIEIVRRGWAGKAMPAHQTMIALDSKGRRSVPVAKKFPVLMALDSKGRNQWHRG